MVGVAQLAELRTVAPAVVGSSPITHPAVLDKAVLRGIQNRRVAWWIGRAPVAQLDRASDFESAGRPFEPGRARQ